MAGSIGPKAISKMISYYYLVSFSTPEYISALKKSSLKTRTKLSKASGLKMKDFVNQVAPEAASRMVSYHQRTRKPEEAVVTELVKLMKVADTKPEKASAFQVKMRELAAHPGRAKEDNRLHFQKGCAFCLAPCRYGFFTLMAEPDLKKLKNMLDAENEKIAQERDAVNVFWTYTKTQILKALDLPEVYIEAYHIGNLSYCLLMLGTAKSRFALPEDHLKLYQIMNQIAIRSLYLTPIHLVETG